ncbi:MAG: alpha-amylase family glycosyl hydrolase [Thermoflexales bacterium]|nr:alpha-amylase family glycosyl hydrolase [Thermoflexales bacterium]
MMKRWGRVGITFGICAAVLCACATPPAASTPAPAQSPSPRPIVAPTATPRPARPTPTPDRRPVIASPAWFNDATLYQVFVRSFYDSDGDGVGDLRGLRQKLDYIQSLGVNTIWINPHYPALTYHGYDVADYQAVNPQFGTLDDFKALVEEIKRRDMHLFVDFVANHTSKGHPFFKDAYGNPQSRYTKWFLFKDARNLSYSSFYGIADLPEWNHGNREVNAYLISAAEFWLDLGVDGLRADYARGVEHWFWADLRKAVKAKHPQAVLLGEVWDGEPSTLRRYFDEGFDALFDFPWYLRLSGGENAVGKGVLNGAVDALLLQPAYRAMLNLYPRGAQIVRFASNHDTNRIASAVEGDPARMRLAAAVSILTPGIPIIYYGEEIGMRGVKGPGPIYDEFRREPMDWYAAETGPGMTTWFKPADRNNRPNDGVSVEEQDGDPGSLLNYYRALIRLRNEHAALRSADFRMMDVVSGCPTCMGIWRWAGDEVMAMIFNFSDRSQTVALDVTASPAPLGDRSEFLLGDAQPFDAATIAPWGTLLIAWR